jgi:pimeloyl-ACP methyl ester carboxylesterase
MLEGRAPWEMAATLAALPWLRGLQRGTGQPVVVFPGLGASDLSTWALRRFLQAQGHVPYAWGLGMNRGPRAGVIDACRVLLDSVAQKHGCAPSLVGWSLGGIYARELAKERPALARCVVTLGSPFAGPPRTTNAWRVYQLLSRQAALDEQQVSRLRQAPPVPTTSIYSRTDGIVAWRSCLNDDAPHTENIEVHASHVGMGVNPLALYALADRLVQDPAHWRRFDTGGVRRWFYGRAGAPIATAGAGPA